MKAVKTIPEPKQKAFEEQAEKTVGDQVYPMWRKAIDLLESLIAHANDNAGLWRFREGPDVYAFYLRRFTSTDLTADQIHEIGLREVERLEKEMDSILRQLGRSEGSIKDRIEELKRDKTYPLTEEGRKSIMADVEAILRDAENRSAALFDRRPKATVVAQPYSAFREASAPASYSPPTFDGSRPGTFQIPLRQDYGIEASEVERYVVYPGQACSYMIGELKILELREKARKALGDRFSLQQFHNVVLGTGTVPLEVLERQVDAYVRAAGGKL